MASATMTSTTDPSGLHHPASKRFKASESLHAFSFLSVHLSVLQSLYNSTSSSASASSASSKTDDGSNSEAIVPDSTWKTIHEFLEHRTQLIQSQQSAHHCRQIEERAAYYLEQTPAPTPTDMIRIKQEPFVTTPRKMTTSSSRSFSLILTKLLQERTQRVQNNLQKHPLVPKLQDLHTEIAQRIHALEEAMTKQSKIYSTDATTTNTNSTNTSFLEDEQNSDDLSSDPVATVERLLATNHNNNNNNNNNNNLSSPGDTDPMAFESRRQSLVWKSTLWKLLLDDVQTILGNGEDHHHD